MAEEHTIEKVFHKLGQIMKDIQKTPQHTCMCPSCNDIPIFSHVFQKKGILNQLSSDNKVHMFAPKHLFAMIENRPLIEYKPVFLNKAFGFWGGVIHMITIYLHL